MRWPLKYQIMMPMMLVLFAAMIVVSGLNAYLLGQRAEARIRAELMEVAQTLSASRFPLTDNVLSTMRGLSGAEFATVTRDGTLVATSGGAVSFEELHHHPLVPLEEKWDVSKTTRLSGNDYFHATMPVRSVESGEAPLTLHILYPREVYEDSVRDAKRLPLLVGLATTGVVAVLAMFISSHLTRPLHRLREHVGRIAAGDFRPLPLTGRNDEIADLSLSINQMASQLTSYEENIRRTERLRTLGQLGAGLAHQMRNSVTGCRLALQIHAQACPLLESDESLSVARRQLELMESHLKRLLQLGRAEATATRCRTDILPILENVLALVAPTAQHLKVELSLDAVDSPVLVQADPDALEQAFLNLVLNAVEAVSTSCKTTAASGSVKLSVTRDASRCIVEVQDSGAGPNLESGEDLFEPFVTSKPDGVGLGLAVAREIINAHEGTITWSRASDRTVFRVELPEDLAAMVSSRPIDERPPTTSAKI